MACSAGSSMKGISGIRLRPTSGGIHLAAIGGIAFVKFCAVWTAWWMITVGTVKLHTSWKVAACAAVRATSDGSLPFWYSVCVLYTTSASMYDIVTP